MLFCLYVHVMYVRCTFCVHIACQLVVCFCALPGWCFDAIMPVCLFLLSGGLYAVCLSNLR